MAATKLWNGKVVTIAVEPDRKNVKVNKPKIKVMRILLGGPSFFIFQ